MKATSSQEAVDLSVVIPAYNEEERLGFTLRRILEYLGRRGDSFEILVVDDGSTDQTVAVAEAHPEAPIELLRLDRNRGKGAALRHGVLASIGSRVLLTDADLSTPIEELEKLEARLVEAPIVIGSRASHQAQIERAQPFYRRWMGKSYNRILHALGLCTDFADTQCGFKLLEGDVARVLFSEMRIDRFAYDMELLELALSRGHEIREVGVVWVNSPVSKVRLFADSASMLRDAVKLSIRLRRLGRRRKNREPDSS